MFLEKIFIDIITVHSTRCVNKYAKMKCLMMQQWKDSKNRQISQFDQKMTGNYAMRLTICIVKNMHN